MLGVPFLRSVYSVFALKPISASSSTKREQRRGVDFEARQSTNIDPRLGLLPITSPSTAMDEFHTVRVLKKPLDPSLSTPGISSKDGRKIPVGVIVLLALLGFVVLCGSIFVARYFYLRRRGRAVGAKLMKDGKESAPGPADDSEKNLVVMRDEGTGNEWQGFGSMVPSVDSDRTLHNNRSDYDDEEEAGKRVLLKVDSAASDDEHDDEQRALDEFGMGWGEHRVRTASEGEGWRESWLDSYSVDEPQMHGEWRPSASVNSMHSMSASHLSAVTSLTPLRPAMGERRGSSAYSAASHSSRMSHASSSSHAGQDTGNADGSTPSGTPAAVAMPLLATEGGLEERLGLHGASVGELSDFAVGLSPSSSSQRPQGRRSASEMGVVNRGRMGDTMLFGGSAGGGGPYPTMPGMDRRGSLGDTVLGFGGGAYPTMPSSGRGAGSSNTVDASHLALARPRPHMRHTSSGLRNSSMVNVVNASDLEGGAGEVARNVR